MLSAQPGAPLLWQPSCGLQISVPVQKRPSSQAEFCARLRQLALGSTHRSKVQATLSLQVTVVPCTQSWNGSQSSVPLQAKPSSQNAWFTRFEQVPPFGLQRSTVQLTPS